MEDNNTWIEMQPIKKTARGGLDSSTTRPMQGASGSVGDVGLTMQDVRFSYKMDRQEDHAGFLGRIQQKVVQGVKEQLSVKNGLQTTASMVVPFYDIAKNIKDTAYSAKEKRDLKQQSNQYSNTKVREVYQTQIDDKSVERNTNLIKTLDPFPGKPIAKTYNAFKNRNDNSSELRKEIVRKSEYLNGAKPVHFNQHEWLNQKNEVTIVRNSRQNELLKTDKEASEEFTHFIANSATFSGEGMLKS